LRPIGEEHRGHSHSHERFSLTNPVAHALSHGDRSRALGVCAAEVAEPAVKRGSGLVDGEPRDGFDCGTEPLGDGRCLVVEAQRLASRQGLGRPLARLQEVRQRGAPLVGADQVVRDDLVGPPRLSSARPTAQ